MNQPPSFSYGSGAYKPKVNWHPLEATDHSWAWQLPQVVNPWAGNSFSLGLHYCVKSCNKIAEVRFFELADFIGWFFDDFLENKKLGFYRKKQEKIENEVVSLTKNQDFIKRSG